MKAVVYDRYGPPEVLTVVDRPVPQPRPGEVLVRVRAVSLNRSDWETLTGKPLYGRLHGPRRPRRPILGSDIAGTVEAVGPEVSEFAPGQDVFGDIIDQLGGFAEYVAVPERHLAPLPAGLDYEVAACLPQSGAIAWQGIVAKADVQPGQRVLINGAGGGSGVYAIQLAKLRGAEVTGVDTAAKLDVMRAAGTDDVIDYTRADFTRLARSWDLVLDVVAHRSAAAYRRALAPGGRLLVTGGTVPTLLRTLAAGVVRPRGRRLGVLAVRQGVRHLAPFVELCRAGAIRTVIDRRFPLTEVPSALRYLGEGHARGKVVVVVP
jgi:NADPH:quinone reductase-like Zn-dependent oxidoreductase